MQYNIMMGGKRGQVLGQSGLASPRITFFWKLRSRGRPGVCSSSFHQLNWIQFQTKQGSCSSRDLREHGLFYDQLVLPTFLRPRNIATCNIATSQDLSACRVAHLSTRKIHSWFVRPKIRLTTKRFSSHASASGSCSHLHVIRRCPSIYNTTQDLISCYRPSEVRPGATLGVWLKMRNLSMGCSNEGALDKPTHMGSLHELWRRKLSALVSLPPGLACSTYGLKTWSLIRRTIFSISLLLLREWDGA